jgi:aspartate aminotransferase
MHTPGGDLLNTDDDVRRYLLQTAGLAIVPFSAFGAPSDRGWFRLSIGVVSVRQIEELAPQLRKALEAVAELGAARGA